MTRLATIDMEKAEAESAEIVADLVQIADDIDERCGQLERFTPSDADAEDALRRRRFVELTIIALRLDALGLRRLAGTISEADYERQNKTLGAMAEKIGATIGGPIQ